MNQKELEAATTVLDVLLEGEYMITQVREQFIVLLAYIEELEQQLEEERNI